MTPAAFDDLVGIVVLSLFHPVVLDAPEVVDDDFRQRFLELFRLERSLPSSLVGPVECCAFWVFRSLKSVIVYS